MKLCCTCNFLVVFTTNISYYGFMFDKCIYFNLNALIRDLNRIWDQEFAASGLTAPQGYLLSLVLQKPGLSQKEVGQTMNLDRSTVTRFLESMEKEKLIKREPSAHDGRVINVYPTKKAEGLKAELQKAFKGVANKVDEKLKTNDIKDLIKLSCQVRADLAK
jgi:MarR family transcriptional regulator, organic hydroperoxide resistance regulator